MKTGIAAVFGMMIFGSVGAGFYEMDVAKTNYCRSHNCTDPLTNHNAAEYAVDVGMGIMLAAFFFVAAITGIIMCCVLPQRDRGALEAGADTTYNTLPLHQ